MKPTRAQRAHIALILREAQRRLDDADILARSASESDSAYLLELLAFELLLKAVCSIHGSKMRTHNYKRLFATLPLAIRRRIKQSAIDRMTTAADYSRLGRTLDLFSRNFVTLRYPYERYEQFSALRYRRVGEGWLARGAPQQRAHYRYCPSELHGLVHALLGEVREWCRANPA